MNIKSYIKDFVVLEKTDIFFISFPKSGGSWLRLLLLNCSLSDKQICYSHQKLNEQMPEIGCGIGLQSGIRFNNKRIIKSHRIIPGFTSRFNCFTTVRNPIHSLASWYTFRELDVQMSLDKYLQSKHGIPYLKQHYNFLRNNKKAIVVSYEQMKENPMFTILNLSQKLDLGINPSRLEYVLENFDRQEQIKVEKNEGRTDLHRNFSTPKNYSYLIDQITAYQDEDLKVILADYQNYHQNSLR